MHICKFVVAQVIDMEDGNRNSLLICNAGDNAIMVGGVVLDISGNPADADQDLFPSPTAMPTEPIIPDPEPEPTPEPEPEPTPIPENDF